MNADLGCLDAWDRRTRELLEEAYVAAGDGPRAGSGSASPGDWRAKRQHLAVPMDHDGTWLDVGCASTLSATPHWLLERGISCRWRGVQATGATCLRADISAGYVDLLLEDGGLGFSKTLGGRRVRD